MSAQRRGICPGIRHPLASGDGYLARWTPHEAIPIASFTKLCDLSTRLGNGVVEITQRGSLQIRGLPAGSAFAEAVDSLGIDVQENPPLLVAPSLEWERSRGAQAASDLRREVLLALRRWGPTQALAPKVSVLVDYAGAHLNLDRLPADVRLFARDDEQVHMAIGGDAERALPLGWIAASDAVTSLLALLECITQRGPTARASELVASDGRTHIELALSRKMSAEVGPSANAPPEYLGAHALPGGDVARGFALAFGYASAETLKTIALLAARHGTKSVRPAPDRTLLLIGHEPEADAEITQQAHELGLISEPHDPRRYVFTCAGAPLCNSARLSTRTWAPKIAVAARGVVSPNSVIHLSGCAKGCAYPRAASITFTGPDRLILEGRADDEPAHYTDIADWIRDLEYASARDCNLARSA